MTGAPTSDLHLADLHAKAAELAIPGYRMLSRAKLIAAIEEAGGDAATPPVVEPTTSASSAGEPAAKDRAIDVEPTTPEEEGVELEGTLLDDDGRQVEVDAGGAAEAGDATEQVSGVLEILPQRYGFIRVGDLGSGEGDVYISAAQIRRCELRSGDEVAGPARAPRRGERHRALVHVDRVNGEEPLSTTRPNFDSLPPVLPERRLPLDGEPAAVLTRAVDLLAPLWLGQRMLVSAAPRSGRTTLLRGIARAASAAEGVELIVLLVDERPEEATAWREAIEDADFAVASAEMAPAEQQRIASVALERARRAAEGGADVVLICDSLSRLAAASGDWVAVKRLFGSGRKLAGGGSLTIVATVLDLPEDENDAELAVTTTENARVVLDPELAVAGVYPALRAVECRISNEEELRSPEELEAVRKLRAELSGLEPAEAANRLRERIEASASNAALLADL